MSDALPVRDGRLDLGPGQPISFDLPGGRVAALCAGAADAPVVLLLPGYTGSKEDFGPLFGPLSEAGLRVVAIDLPGQYESAPLADPGGYGTDALGQVIVTVTRHLGAAVHLLGHSFGGLVARSAVLTDHTAFRSLVLMDSGPAQIGGNRRALIDHLGPLLDQAGVEGVYATTLALAQATGGYTAPDAVVAEFLRRRFLAGTAGMLRGMGDALRTEPDRTAELAAVPLPKLVLYGADDDAWPPAVQDEMAARLRAHRVVIPQAAHSPAVENPAATAAELIDFLLAPEPR